MDRSSNSLTAAAVALPQPRALQPRPTRGPPVGNGWAPAGHGAAEPPREVAAERDRIAQRLTDVVVRRLFAAGLDLQAALGLIGDHPGADKIGHAVGELDQAITDLRGAIFDRVLATAAGATRRGDCRQ